MTDRKPDSNPLVRSSESEIDSFLARARALDRVEPAGPRGRLIFSLDATMSRQPTWDAACRFQGEMFHAAAEIGSLDVQLVYYRGFDECRASRWVSDPKKLAELMAGLQCHGGYTQIRKVLSHARGEAERSRVHALVHVGDCMEENLDELSARAGELALFGIPVFMFQEGDDPAAEQAFAEIARLTHGAHVRFGLGAGDELKTLLKAAAVFAAGGRQALADMREPEARRLLTQMR